MPEFSTTPYWVLTTAALKSILILLAQNPSFYFSEFKSRAIRETKQYRFTIDALELHRLGALLLLSVLFFPDGAGLPAASARPSIHPAWVLVVVATRAMKHGFIRGHPLLTERAFNVCSHS